MQAQYLQMKIDKLMSKLFDHRHTYITIIKINGVAPSLHKPKRNGLSLTPAIVN